MFGVLITVLVTQVCPVRETVMNYTLFMGISYFQEKFGERERPCSPGRQGLVFV